MQLKRTLAALALAQMASFAHAGDCWVKTVENADTGYGTRITTKRFEPMRARLLKLEAVQRADGAINAINDVRYRVHRYVDKPTHPGGLMVGESSVWLHTKDSWKGACELQPFADRTHFAALHASVNNLRMFEPNTSGRDKEDLVWFHPPKQTGEVGGYPVFENRLVLTAGGIAPFADVTVRDYLDDWQRKLQRERSQRSEGAAEEAAKRKEWDDYIRQLEKTDPKTAAAMRRTMEQGAANNRQYEDKTEEEWRALQSWRESLSEAQLAQPVYLNPRSADKYRFGYATGPEGNGRKLVMVNPALWKGARSDSDFRAIVLHIYVNDGPTAKQLQVARWLENVDVGPYKALLQN